MKKRKETNALVFPLLFALRVANSLLLQTHFEPDEYFQSIEIAMDLILKRAQVTWEWMFGLRSFVFVLIYYFPLVITHKICFFLESLGLGGSAGKEGIFFMLSAPYTVKIISSLISALCDYSTIQAYRLLYKSTESTPPEIVLVCCMNIGQWLYSTRSHINSFEMSLSSYLFYRMLKSAEERDKKRKVRMLLVNSAISSMLMYVRPTSAALVGVFWVYALKKETDQFRAEWNEAAKKKEARPKRASSWLVPYLQHSRVLSTYNLLSSILALGICSVVDSIFYKELIFVPWVFINVNIALGVSRVFGTLSWYFVPLFFCVLLGAYAAMALLSRVSYTSIEVVSSLLYLGVHCIIAHKEMRFLLPALPFFNIIIAKNLRHVHFTRSRGAMSMLRKEAFSRKVFLVNFLVGILIGIDYQHIGRPLHFLRKECRAHLSQKKEPIFIFSVFNPYMLPVNTYLGHKRVVVKSIDNNPDISLYLEKMKRVERFKKNTLVLQEHDIFSSKMAENLRRHGVVEYNYLVINSKYNTEVEKNFSEFVKVYSSTFTRFPEQQEISVYKRAIKQ